MMGSIAVSPEDLLNAPRPHSPWISLDSAELSAAVDPFGAQLSILRDRAAQDLLWDGDPAVWAGRSPLLFPIVGALAGGHYRLGAHQYPMARHGFARGKAFEVIKTASSSAEFRLKADASTLKVYPFDFELSVYYTLSGPTLEVLAKVQNIGESDMPASFGYHPAFRWPLPHGQPRSSHFVEFQSDEPDPIRRLDANGLLMAHPIPTPVLDRQLLLRDTLFHSDVVIFDAIRSRSVTYGADNGPRLKVSFSGAPYLGVWTKPGAQFICIEPWHGIADPVGFSEDFTAKPGIFILAPGAVQSIGMQITLLPAAR